MTQGAKDNAENLSAIVSVKVKIAQPADRLRLLNNNNPTFSFYFSSSTKIKH
jgi:hypothetical protein